MFSKISQLSKTVADELTRINEEVNNPALGGQQQLADPEIAKKIINTETPEISDITKPDEIAETPTTLANDSGVPNADNSTSTPEDVKSDTNSSATEEPNGTTKSVDDPNIKQDPKLLVPGTQIKLSSLSPEIRTRLNKYAKYEKKYPQLYEAYKLEKKKTALIRAFENMLKEQTPCSSIGELNAMRDYLNSITNQGKILNAELSKITKEKKAEEDKVESLTQKIKDLQKALTTRNADEATDLLKLKDEVGKLKEVNLKQLDIEKKYTTILEENKSLKQKVKELENSGIEKEELEKMESEKKLLQNQIESLTTDNQNLTKQTESFQQDLKELKQSRTDEAAESLKISEELNEKVANLEKKVESSKKLNDLFKNKVESLTEELEKKSTTQSSTTPDLHTTQSKNSKKKKKAKNNNTKSTEEPQNSKTTEMLSPEEEPAKIGKHSDIQIIELKHEVDELNQKYSEEIKKSTNLARSIESKNAEIEELKDMVRDVGDSLVEAQKANKSSNDLEKTLKDTKAELESKLNELEMLRIQNANALTDYEKTKTSLSSKVDDYIKRIDTLESTLAKKNSDYASLQKKVNDYESNKNNLEALLAKNKKNEQKLQDQIKTLMEEKNKLQKELSLLKTTAEKDIANKNDYQNMKIQLARKERVLVEAENKIKFLQEDKSKINDLMIELKVQNKELKNHELSYKEEKNNLVKLNEKLKAEANESTLRINRLSLDNTKLSKQLEELQDQYNEVKHIKSSSNDQVESYKKRLEELLMRNKEYENKIDILQEELTQSRTMLQERTREMTTMRKLVIDNEEAQNSDLKELKYKYDRLLEEKEKSDNDALVSIRSKQREIDDLKRKCSDLSTKLEQLEATNSSLDEKLKVLDQNRTLEMSRKNSLKVEESTQDVYNSKMINSLRESLTKTEERLKELEELNSKLRTVNQDSSDKLIRLNKKYKLLSLQYKRRMSESGQPHSRNNSFTFSRNNSIIMPLEIPDATLLHPEAQSSELITEKEDVEGIKEKSIYIKNVLMGFLEHKEQRQMLLPVIKTLLYMSDDDTKKLNELLV